MSDQTPATAYHSATHIPEVLKGFRRGSAVALKAGGTPMVVRNLVRDSTGEILIKCEWNIDGVAADRDYYPEQLIRIEDAKYEMYAADGEGEPLH